jgi:hypothetical protein
LGRSHSHEAVDEAKNLKREGDLFGETSLSTYRKALKVWCKGLARSAKAKRVGAPSRDGAGRSRRRSESDDEDVSRCFGFLERSHPA